mmetsp:Transcript_1478/g.4883  ORF Transcript_1478/g.4883 Transcript_1478/m.4883 type:complete len:117 (-) Transcript_1478:23-373(-)
MPERGERPRPARPLRADVRRRRVLGRGLGRAERGPARRRDGGHVGHVLLRPPGQEVPEPGRGPPSRRPERTFFLTSSLFRPQVARHLNLKPISTKRGLPPAKPAAAPKPAPAPAAS